MLVVVGAGMARVVAGRPVVEEEEEMGRSLRGAEEVGVEGGRSVNRFGQRMERTRRLRKETTLRFSNEALITNQRRK